MQNEQAVGSKYIPSNKAHNWDIDGKVSPHLTVLRYSDITQVTFL